MPFNYSGTLVVPISINARYLESGMSVNDATAEFRRLPWSNKDEVYNSSTPFLGEAVMSPPFQDQNFVLGSGVHLHWVLPRSHRTYQAGPSDISGRVLPPAAPNCWLVTRKSDGAQWVIDSDYISLTQSKKQGNENAVTVPSANIGQADEQAYVYLGRQLSLADWLAAPSLTPDQKWSSMGKGALSAFGYGELAFNSYYPNCHSVFGFYDPEPTQPASDTYEVLGWYSNPDDDIVKTTYNRLHSLLLNPASDPDLLNKLFEPEDGACPAWCKPFINASLDAKLWQSAWRKNTNAWADLQANDTALQAYYQYGMVQELKWSFASEPATSCPQSSVYYAQTVMGQSLDIPEFTQLALGHTGLEALCAYLAPQVLANMPAPAAGDAPTEAEIEADLNALMHGAAVQRDLVDIDENIKESEHNAQFEPHQGETIWRIRREKKVEHQTHAGLPEGDEAFSLPGDLAGLLNDLNLAEVAYQEAQEKLATARFQIYSDWCKYMQCSYPPLGMSDNLPDPDLIKNYVEWQCSEELFGNLQTDLSEAYATKNTALTALNAALASVNSTLEHHEYIASEVPGPRYYAPKDPVILFASKSSQTVTAGQCYQVPDATFIASVQVPAGSAKTSTVVQAMCTAVATVATTSALVAESEPWSPQLLQWLVDYKPDTTGSSISSSDGNFSTDFMGAYSLPDGEFSLEKSNVTTSSQGIEFAGTTYASTGTKAHMIKILQGIVDQATDSEAVPVLAATQALDILKEDSLMVITQALGGFHKGLLQQKHNVQLPIADPIGFPAYQPFTQDVNAVVGDGYVAAPLPNNYFFPIRAGLLSLEKLALIDAFGISNGVDTEGAYIARSLYSGQAAHARFMPAFPQETRLNFRWLAATSLRTDTDIEMNSHPASSPICGWLMPNNLENSLMIYDSEGNGLGSMIFDETSNNYKSWQIFPASTKSLADFPATQGSLNKHFFEVLNAIKADTSDFLRNLEMAQGQISPEYFAGHDSMAILVGKPVAVVRAQIGFNTRSGTLYDQGWIPFENQLKGQAPVTTEYDQVSVKIRLGENGQLNDGLIAFAEKAEKPFNWVDTNDGNDAKNYVKATLSSGTTNLTMLMDPHGQVHATSGVLPVKTINIPPEQYTAALKKMQIDFRIQPILTPANKLQLSLPKEYGYQWSWLQQIGEDWLEVPDMMLTSQAIFAHAWSLHLDSIVQTTPTADTLWPLLSGAGWVKALPHNATLFQLMPLKPGGAIESSITTSISTAIAGLSATEVTDLITDIQNALNGSATGMVAFKNQLEFYPKQELIEGWLRLSEVSS